MDFSALPLPGIPAKDLNFLIFFGLPKTTPLPESGLRPLALPLVGLTLRFLVGYNDIHDNTLCLQPPRLFYLHEIF